MPVLGAAEGDGELVTRAGLRLPASALTWRFSRASGPGGQHVNTSDTRVELTADLTRLEGSAAAVARVRTILGEQLRVVASVERSQVQNRVQALRRLAERVDTAARPRRDRRPTVPPRRAVEARLDAKRQVARRKALRRAGAGTDD